MLNLQDYPGDVIIHWLNTTGTTTDIVRWIDPNLVLAKAWSPRRLAEARKRLAAGEQAPPIVVVGARLGAGRVLVPERPLLRFRKVTLYHVDDGMHRTIAAREYGLKKIKARITGYWDTDNFASLKELDRDGKLYLIKRAITFEKESPLKKLFSQRIAYPVQEELLQILLALGVPRLERYQS